TAQRVVADLRVERSDKFRTDATRAMLFLLLAGGGFALYRRRVLNGHGLQLLVAILLLVDLWGVDRRYLNKDRMVSSAEIERSIPEYAFDRFILENGSEPGSFRVLSLEGAPTGTARPSYFYESLSGYHGAKLRLYQDFLDQLLITSGGQLNTPALRMLNTRFVVSRSPVADATEVFRDEQTGFSVYELQGYLPRSYFVDSTVVVSSPEAAWQILGVPSFDPSKVAVVGSDLGITVARRDSASTVRSAVTSYSPRRIVVEAATDATRLLVLSEVYYPAGWHATIDGSPVDIIRVNHLLRGVVVPPGASEIAFEFSPAGHTVGVWVAGASTAVIYVSVLLLILLKWRERPDAGDEIEPPAHL
ncbi:MAG: YfhO family protein, partial [Rhodothermales bacterium]|nr:YfhO family protein [Rhodothermales bacterium]